MDSIISRNLTLTSHLGLPKMKVKCTNLFDASGTMRSLFSMANDRERVPRHEYLHGSTIWTTVQNYQSRL